MIVPMKKLTLAALLEHREAILQALQSICAVQLISIGEGEQSSAAAEGRVQRLQSAEELLKPYAGKAGFGPKPEATRQELEEDIQPALEICAELEGLQRRIAQNGSDTEKRRLQLGSLLPWADMTDPLEKVHSTASIKVMTGTVPAEGVKALMETGALVQLYGGDKERAALVICPNEEYAGIAPSIRATGFQEKCFGDIRGTALENTFPLIDSSTNPMGMLMVCAAFGIIHMFYAVLIATWNCLKHKDYMGALIDNMCWIFIVSGLIMQAAPMAGLPQGVAEFGKWLAIVSAVLVFLFAGRSKKNIAGRLISGAGKLYDVTSWLGDVLSYARIFALGLSTGVIGLVLNTLCWDMLFASFKGNPALMLVGFIIVTVVSVALHVFMMLISTLGCFVHSARLQYVEFFGKFYEAGGKAFKPLRYETKYVNVK